MATFQEHLNLVKKLNRKRVSEILFEAINEVRNELLSDNKEQLLEGKDSESKKLFSKKNNSGVYSEATEYISTNDALLGKGNKIKKAGDHYTLENYGDFFKGFYLKIYHDKILFGSKDKKTQLLIEDFGDIFGLTDDNLKAVIQEKILPFFISKNREALRI